jgi:hypothetical protein
MYNARHAKRRRKYGRLSREERPSFGSFIQFRSIPAFIWHPYALFATFSAFSQAMQY